MARFSFRGGNFPRGWISTVLPTDKGDVSIIGSNMQPRVGHPAQRGQVNLIGTDAGLNVGTGGGGGGSQDVTWLPATNAWGIVGLNTLQSVAAAYPGSGNSFIGNNTFIDQWDGSSFAPRLGTLGSILYGPSGGHGTYDGSDVYRYDLATRLFSLLKDSYRPTSRPGGNANGEFPDGSPHAPHSYQGHQCLPIAGVWNLVVPQTYFDLSDGNNRLYVSHRLNVESPAGAWVRGPTFSNMLHTPAAYDHSRRCIWYYPEASGPLQRFDGTTITSFGGGGAISQPSMMTYDNRRDLLWMLAFSLGTPIAMMSRNLQNPTAAWTSYTTASTPHGAATLDYVEEIDRILSWPGGAQIYQWNPGSPNSGWSVFATATGTPPTLPNTDGGAGIYSKIRYVPRVGALLGTNQTGQQVRAYRIAGTTAPSTADADWAARSTGPGVLWSHDFSRIEEIRAFAWENVIGGNPNLTGNTLRQGTGDPTAGYSGTYAEIFRNTGSVDGTEWWRPFNPINAGGNGKLTNDLAANGTVARITLNNTQGSSAINQVATGFIGNATYHSTGGFIGTEYYFQARVKMDPNRFAGNNSNGGKLLYFTRCDLSLTTQEIVTQSQEEAFSTRALMMYRGGSGPGTGGIYADGAGSATYGNQAGVAIGMANNGLCRLDNANGQLANCWQWPTASEWVTLLWHVIPGTNGGGNTTVELFACQYGEYQYRRIWRQTDVNLSYSVKNGHSAVIFSGYMNGRSIGTAFFHRMTQMILSFNPISPPKYYA
jgi:hypothetical protein